MKRVRLTLECSRAVNETLDDLAERMCCSKAEVLRRGIALMEIAVEARVKGLRLGLADEGATTIHTRILL